MVEAVGAMSPNLRAGDRVAYCMVRAPMPKPPIFRPGPQSSCLPAISDEVTAAAALLKGLTARYLLKATYQVKSGETILFHSAAGGVGLIASQWARTSRRYRDRYRRVRRQRFRWRETMAVPMF